MKSNRKLNSYDVNLREKWGLNPNGPLDITPIVLPNLPNLTILYIPFSQTTSGMCIKDENNEIIGINSTHSKGRQRFTVAHELYHLLIENNINKPILCNAHNRNTSEIEADKFASYLLMTEEGLDKYCEMMNINEWNLTNIISVEQYFQISHQALLIRLKNNRSISKKEYEYFSDSYISYESKIRDIVMNYTFLLQKKISI